jgi:hypothetical protein
MNKKIIVYTGIGLFISAGIAASHQPRDKSDWKNVKVIPKNTDEDQMERLMTRYSKQLGVSCLHCHPYTKPEIMPKRVDFASEEKPEKLIARNMMRMTDKINKKYFGYKNDYSFESLNKFSIVTCQTCHRGLPTPNNRRLFF